MSEQQPLIRYITVTREIDAPIGEAWGIVAAFGAERAWYPGCRKLTLTGFGIGSIRTFDYEYPAGKHKGERYTFSEEMTAYDADKHSMSFRVRRPDYPDMFAIGTTVLDEIGPNKTRFRWLADGNPLPDEYAAILREDLDERFNGLITAIADQLV
ncbi:Polyketide cyclase/dehydrase [Ilyonectria robusta]